MPDISSFFRHHGKVTPKPPEAEEYKVIDASWLVKRLWWFTMKGCRYMPLSKNNFYTVTDIYALPDGKRAELIDGQIYDIAHPGSFHQEIVMELSATIRDYIKKNNENGKVYIAPFAVFLNQDEYNYVEPDISIICDLDKINDKGCNGAPDFVAEVASSSSQCMDYLIKLFKYRTAGVKEYWIINPFRRTIQVYSFEDPEDSIQYAFENQIPMGIYKDLKICISDLLNN